MIITLTGANSFTLKQRLDELVTKFVKQNGELALERFDGEEVEAQVIFEAISNLPFLAQKKMVVVRSGSLNKDFVNKIEQIISSIPDWCEVVLYEPQIDRRSIYFKVLKTKSKFEEYAQLDSRELAKWLMVEAKNQGGELAVSEANYLIERLGGNQAMLYNELQKLLTYQPKINRETINLLTEPNPQTKIFDLLNAAFGGHKRRALKLYQEQRAQKAEPQQILSMIAWQLRLLALAKQGGQKTSLELSKDSGMAEFSLRGAKRLAADIAEAKLKNLVDEALELDTKAKTSSFDLDEALKTYIVSI